MEKELLSIKQIAERLGVSKQRVYRCIKKHCINEAHQETVNGNSVLMYDEAAYTKIYEILNGVSSEVHEAHQKSHHDTLNEALYEALLKQLEEKDKQIAELQKLLDQSQQLHALEQQKVLALESKAAEEAAAEPKEQPKKRWWQLFK